MDTGGRQLGWGGQHPGQGNYQKSVRAEWVWVSLRPVGLVGLVGSLGLFCVGSVNRKEGEK